HFELHNGLVRHRELHNGLVRHRELHNGLVRHCELHNGLVRHYELHNGLIRHCGLRNEAWDIVVNDVTKAIQEFFLNGNLLKELNHTIISLIPKKFSEVTYHPYCSKLELINLCFPDDLFLSAHGDVDSARVIMDTSEEFKSSFGLSPSLPKSTTHHRHNVTPPPAAFSTSPPSTPQNHDHPPLPANNTTIMPPSLTEATSTAAACHHRHHSQPLPYSTTPPTPQHCHHHHPHHHLIAITFVAPPSRHHHQHRHDPIDTAGSVLDMSQTSVRFGGFTAHKGCLFWCFTAAVRVCLFLGLTAPKGCLFLLITAQGVFGVWFCSHGCVCFAPGVFGFGFSGNRAVRFGRLHPRLVGLSYVAGRYMDIVEYLIPFAKRRSCKSVIAKLVLSASAYYLWQERNARLFSNQKWTVAQIVDFIKTSVRSRSLRLAWSLCIWGGFLKLLLSNRANVV
nr:reverse transcriptase domain, reverse transcriptase zinc-binding domain protein [Tanacetum cinerariifolium]